MSTPIKRENTVVVGLLWHSVASGNLGVVALTLSQIAILEQAAQDAGVAIHVKVFGWRLDGSMQAAPGFAQLDYTSIDARALINPFSVFRKALNACQLILDVGEGDSFSDIYGLKRLLYLCYSKRLAGAGGRQLVLSPQTLGPFASPTAEKIACWSLRYAAHVFARDSISRQWAEPHLPAEKLSEAIDMAFCLPFAPNDSPRHGARIQIGLNISGLLYSGGYRGANSFALSVDFATLSHQLIEWALALPNADVWLVPHVHSRDIPEEDDLTTAEALRQRYPAVLIAGPFAGPSEAKSFMSGLDFFVGGRMHACIGAFSAGVPTVPLAYSRKFNGLFSALDYRTLVDCKVVTTEQAFDQVVTAFGKRDQICRDVERGCQIAHEKIGSYRRALVENLKSFSD